MNTTLENWSSYDLPQCRRPPITGDGTAARHRLLLLLRLLQQLRRSRRLGEKIYAVAMTTGLLIARAYTHAQTHTQAARSLADEKIDVAGKEKSIRRATIDYECCCRTAQTETTALPSDLQLAVAQTGFPNREGASTFSGRNRL